MIGLDTNVLVRLFVKDDPDQSERARRFVKDRCTPETPGFVNSIVLAEFVWVLGRYGYDRAEIARALETLLDGLDRVVENHDEVVAALVQHKAGGADFVDCLIGNINRAKGCGETVTFDRKAARLEGFVAIA